MAVSDSHEQLILSPQCIIEANNPNFNYSGKKVFGINVANHDDVRFTVTHSDGSDLTKVEAEGILEIDTGRKGNKDGTSLQVTSHHGNIGINADDGSILIKADGKSITLDAESIFLKGRKLIQIGDENTQDVKIIGNKIDAIGNSGNIPNILAQHLQAESFLGKCAKGTAFASSFGKIKASKIHPAFKIGLRRL